jgi:hypothetical protein
MSTYVFTNGQELVSTALTDDDVTKILQSLTLNVLGIDPATDPKAYYSVRVGWKAQPSFLITEDVVSIRVSEKDDPNNKQRDRKYLPQEAGSTIQQVDTFMRFWDCLWSFYGPNGFDHARLLKSALRLRFTHDTLIASQLTFVPRFTATLRAPELFEGAWWERSDVKLTLTELVTETLVINTIASVEVLLFTERGQVADIKAPA